MAITFNFSGQTALVTGATSGIGEAVALGLAKAGANVAVVGRDETRLARVRDAIAAEGVGALGLRADVRRREDVRSSTKATLDRFGQIDILVNSAGIVRFVPAIETSDDDWDDTIATNLTGTFLYCREVGKAMAHRGYGRIVNIASVDAFNAVPTEVAYCASKAGVVAITKVFAVELVKSGVHVNAVAPCDFDTPMVAEYMSVPENLAATLAGVPVGRIGKLSELVPAVLYLASPEASMVVGHTLLVDGGRTII
ncbi:MAG: SDR family NAD(P)-dependent oxidoreductase [Candidatus Binatia bacterium]